MRTSRQFIVIVFAALCLVVLVGGVHGVVSADPCCNNTPRQCEAASLCYDNGFCLDPINMCQTNTVNYTCNWVMCKRID